MRKLATVKCRSQGVRVRGSPAGGLGKPPAPRESLENSPFGEWQPAVTALGCVRGPPRLYSMHGGAKCISDRDAQHAEQ